MRSISINNIQRLVYAAAFVIWTIMWFYDPIILSENSKFGVPILWLVILELSLLLVQAIYNTRLIWKILLGLTGLFYLKFIFDFVSFIIEFGEPDYFGSTESFEIIGSLILGAGILFLVFKLKPKKNKTVPNTK